EALEAKVMTSRSGRKIEGQLVPPVVRVIVAGQADVLVDRSGDRARHDRVVPLRIERGETVGMLQRIWRGAREPPALMQPEGGDAADDTAGRKCRHRSCVTALQQ